MLYDKTHPYEALISPPGHSKRTHARSRSFQLHKLKPTHRRWLRNSVLVAAFVFILFLYSNHDSSHYRPNIPMYIVSKSDTDLNFGFADREPGNVERLGRTSPRNPPLKRKLGLVAIPAGEKAKPRVDELVRTFGMEHFSYFIFHWDNSTWDDLPWYRDVISARAIGQTKFWFAKRFLTPDVVQSYDYLWLWDDDIQLGSNFDAVGFTEILKSYNIHIAQPSLTIGQHGPQANVVTHRKVGIGRFTNFVEIMIPIFSSAAWACSWRLIPFDSRATWGVDNAWYPVCGSIGYCRFAVIDKYPVKHMDTKTFDNSIDSNLFELSTYLEAFHAKCRSVEHSQNVPRHLQLFCRVWTMRNPEKAFDTIRSIKEEDKMSDTCPDPYDFPGVVNLPFWQLR